MTRDPAIWSVRGACLGLCALVGCGGGTAARVDGPTRDADAEEASEAPSGDAGPDVVTPDDGATGDAGADGPAAVRFKAVTVSVGGTCALTTDGVAYCWGAGGALGVSAGVTSSATPLAVETTDRFDAIGLGDGLGCALTADGSALCWGSNFAGSVGDGTTTPRKTPVAVSGGLPFKTLAVAHYTACATTADGAAYCWGSNAHGTLGDGTTMDRAVPTRVSSALAFSQISTSGDHTCALTREGAAWCWGGNTLGALGDGTKNDALTPVEVMGGLAFGVIVAAETTKTCGLTLDGTAYCWGIQANGALGNGVEDNVLSHAIPTAVAVMGGGHYTALAGDVFSSCAVTTAGAGACWGFNGDGNLGDGSTTNRTAPVPVLTTLPLTAVALSHWENGHACALTGAGGILCWGNNSAGALGDGTMTARPVPVSVLAPAGP